LTANPASGTPRVCSACFGPTGYGHVMGRLAGPFLVMQAVAPLVMAFVIERASDPAALALAAGFAALAFICSLAAAAPWRELTFEDALVTINQVDVTSDLKNAHVYVSVLGAGAKAAIAKLEAHRIPLQTQLARHVVLKYTPHLIFHLDDSIERGTRVIKILQQIETPVSDPE